MKYKGNKVFYYNLVRYIFGILSFSLIIIFFNKHYVFEDTTTLDLGLYIFSKGDFLQNDLVLRSQYLGPRAHLLYLLDIVSINYNHFVFNLIVLKSLVIFSFVPINLVLINNFFNKNLYEDILFNSILIIPIYLFFYKFSFFGWHAPRMYIAPSLVSYLLISIGLLLEKKNKYAFYLIFFTSFFIHPVTPLFYFLYNFLKNIYEEKFNQIISKNFLINISLCFLIYLIYNFFYYADLSSEAIDIYLDRHKHHYLPTSFFNVYSALNLGFVFIIFFSKNRKNNYLIFYYFFLLVLITGLQYLFVDLYRISSLSLLGLTRLTTFHYFFMSLILISVSKNYFKIINVNINHVILFSLKNISVLLILVVFIFILLINFNNESRLQSEKTLSWINENTNKNSQLITINIGDISLINHKIRVYSKRAIFVDATFPMTSSNLDILEWKKRRMIVKNISDDLNNVCRYDLSNNVIFLTNDLTDLKEYYGLQYKKFKNLYLIKFEEINKFC